LKTFGTKPVKKSIIYLFRVIIETLTGLVLEKPVHFGKSRKRAGTVQL